MQILPAIDLFEGKAVRLEQGDYTKMTVYSKDPVSVAQGFKDAGASYAHIVDLEGAREGTTANFETVRQIIEKSGLTVEIGGGIRSAEVVSQYLNAGAGRVILGTAAIKAPGFVFDMAHRFGDKIAVSVDIKDGRVAVSGWTETSDRDAESFCRELVENGIKTIICTDISKDGMLGGTNIDLYRHMREILDFKLIASGGITSCDEIRTLAALGAYGAILGKAMYTGVLTLTDAIKAAEESN